MDGSDPISESAYGMEEGLGPGGGGELRMEGGEEPGVGGWVYGAYALLLLWGAAYLTLFFSDRLPW
jgi:hypothetical protein